MTSSSVALSFTVTGLSQSTTYYFAIKTSDEVPNESALSNVPSATTQTVTYAVSVTPDGSDTLSVLPSNGTASSYSFTVTNNSNVTESFDLLAAPGDPVAILTVDSITGSGVTDDGVTPDSARVANLAVSEARTIVVWFSVADAGAGTADSLYLTGRSVSDSGVSDVGSVFLEVVKPNLTASKTVSPSVNPPPGTDLAYTISVTNTGSAAAVASTVVDSIPAELEFKVGSVVTTLPVGVNATVEYSDDGASTYTYTPVSGSCSAPAGYDRCVTDIRWTVTDDFDSAAPDNSGTFEFVARIR